jgi:hypothetical protein
MAKQRLVFELTGGRINGVLDIGGDVGAKASTLKLECLAACSRTPR